MSQIDLQIDETTGIARLSLQNSGKRNAISRKMLRQIPTALAKLQNAKVLLLCGAGDHFSAGADILEMGELQDELVKAAKFRAEMQTALEAIRSFSAPVIAWINGNCFGAGVAFAMACDFRFCDSAARFSIPPARLGLLYPQKDIDRLVELTGPAMAKQILFTGEVFPAEEARRTGLVNDIKDQAGTLETCEQIAQNAQSSIFGLKKMVNGEQSKPDAAFDAAFGTEDFTEGLKAFEQKRKPRYS